MLCELCMCPQTMISDGHNAPISAENNEFEKDLSQNRELESAQSGNWKYQLCVAIYSPIMDVSFCKFGTLMTIYRLLIWSCCTCLYTKWVVRYGHKCGSA